MLIVMRKIKFLLVAFIAVFMFSFIPSVYAEDGNYYELKFYEKYTQDDFSDEENALMVLILEQEDLLHYSAVYPKVTYYNSDNKLLFTLDYSSSDSNGIIEIGDNVTFQDSIEYIFTNDEKIQLEENYPELSGYRGVKLLFAESIENKECDSVCIESVELDSKSDKVKILSKPKYQDLTVKFDIKFRKLQDYVKYKIVINNTTNEDYAISEKSNFGNSQYITYEYGYEGSNKVAKKNSKTVMYITVKYNQKVPNEKFDKNGIFTEENNLIIVLDNDKGMLNVLKNPNTGHNLLIVFIVFLGVIGISFMLYKTTKHKKYLTIFIISLILLPFSIYAMEKLQINVDSKIQIARGDLKQFPVAVTRGRCVTDYSEAFENASRYTYEEGMTWEEWAESEYNVDHIKIFSTQDSANIEKDYSKWHHTYASSELIECCKNGENKSSELLFSCVKQFRSTSFSYSSLIVSDGLYVFENDLPCPV